MMMEMTIGDELAEWRMEGDTSSGASGRLPQRGTFGSAGDEGIAPTGGARSPKGEATTPQALRASDGGLPARSSLETAHCAVSRALEPHYAGELFGGAGDEGIAPTGGAATGFINSQFPEGSKVIRRAVLHFGPRRQMVKAMEELGELMQAIARYVGAKDEGGAGGFEMESVAEEIADVEIMLQQVRIICDIAPELEGIWRDRKLRRLMGRMDKHG